MTSLGSVVRGFAAEVRPVPMALCLATVVFGSVLAAGPMVDWNLLVLVFINAFLYLYTAHLNDTMFDVIKGEYEKGREFHAVRINDVAYLPRLGFGLEVPKAPLLSRNHYLIGILACSTLGSVMTWWISRMVGWFYVPLALTGLALALTYSAGLDKVPALGDTMWEAGVIAALFCGYYAMKGMIDFPIIQTAVGLFIALAGVKVLDGWYDVPTDSRISKMTLPVFLYSKGVGLEVIRDLGYALVYVTMMLLLAQLPPPFYPGIIGGSVIIVFSHLYYRGRDMEKRLGLTIGGIGIITFIFWAIFTILAS